MNEQIQIPVIRPYGLVKFAIVVLTLSVPDALIPPNWTPVNANDRETRFNKLNDPCKSLILVWLESNNFINYDADWLT